MRFQEVNLLEAAKLSLLEYKDSKDAANALYSVLAHFYRSQLSASSGDPSANANMIEKIRSKVVSEFGEQVARQVEARFPFKSWDAAKSTFENVWNDPSKTEQDISSLKSKILDQFGAEGPKPFFSSLPPRPSAQAKTQSSAHTSTDKSSSFRDFEYMKHGWLFRVYRFVDPTAGKAGSNKVWGFAMKDNRAVIFWGKFRGAMQFKPTPLDKAYEVSKLKVAKGYKRVKADPLAFGYIYDKARDF
jgi:hypothetical protein